MSEQALFHQLDDAFAAILAGASPAGRLRTARAIALELRRDQSRRIARQQNPDGSAYEKRRRRIIRSQAGISFVWEGETRRLRTWRGSKGRRGRMLTGFDEDRGAIRSFYRADIERYLSVNFTQVRRDTTKTDPMFRRLRTTKFLKSRATESGAEVGFSGVPASIAKIHQFGLRARVSNSGPETANYPRRELVGLTRADRLKIARQIIDSLGGD